MKKLLCVAECLLHRVWVSYQGKTLKSSLKPEAGGETDPQKYNDFSKAWFEAYSVVEEAVKESMDFPPGAHT